MTPEHKNWVAQATAGDKDALGNLLEAFGPDVEAGLTISPVWQGLLDRADVMQVTYLEAFLQISRFDPSRPESFPAWLRRMAENNLRDAIRALDAKKKPSPRNQLDPHSEDAPFALFDVLTAGMDSPSRVVRRDEINGLLRAALRRLPTDYARVIELLDLEGRSIEETSASMNRSEGAVYMLRMRGHERLREFLGTPSQIFESKM